MSPDGSKIVPPEEKLLRVIRAKGSPPVQAPQRAQPAIPRPVGRPSKGWRLPTWWLTALNLLLGCLVVGELVAFLLIAGSPSQALTGPMVQPKWEIPPPETASPELPAEPAGQAESIPKLSSVGTRPLFQITERLVPSSPRQETQAPSAQAKALAARLSLIGIVTGNPAQAIIEDSQTRKTYFVTAGQHLIEGIIVEEVREDRAVLDLDGEKIELSL